MKSVPFKPHYDRVSELRLLTENLGWQADMDVIRRSIPHQEHDTSLDFARNPQLSFV